MKVFNFEREEAMSKEEKEAKFAAKLASVGKLFGDNGEVKTKELFMQGGTAALYGNMQRRSTVFKALPNLLKSDVGNNIPAALAAYGVVKYGPKSWRPHAARVMSVAVNAAAYNFGSGTDKLDGVLGSINNTLNVKDKAGNLVQPDVVNENGASAESLNKLTVKPKP